MLPRRLRLSRRAFSLPAHARRYTSPHFSAILSLDTPEGGCAAVISKKVARLSTTRHLLKRRMLVVLRPWCSPAYTLIVHARAGSSSLPYQELRSELSSLMTRLLPEIRA